MRRRLITRFGFLLLLLAAVRVSAAEHPGLSKDAKCLSCHAEKNNAKSLHSGIACTVCHLIKTEGGVTTIYLASPRQEICFACHEKSVESQQHSPAVKGECLDCHDPHSSSRRFLLREKVDARHK